MARETQRAVGQLRAVARLATELGIGLAEDGSEDPAEDSTEDVAEDAEDVETADAPAEDDEVATEDVSFGGYHRHAGVA
jgi:hypothetical protein